MLQMRCPTCGTLLGDIQLIHEQEIKKIDSSKLTEVEKNKKKEDLINTYGLDRYCCKTRLLGYVDTVNIII
jgi:DNA-directed RNA polymerase subunit N (RpoN/RPB10)